MGSILKCQVEMAAFVSFLDLNDMQRIITDFERSSQTLSATNFTLQEPWRDTGIMRRSGSFIPKDSHLPMGCSAEVMAQGKEVTIGRVLGTYDLTDKVALFLGCGGQSREAYFTKQ